MNSTLIIVSLLFSFSVIANDKKDSHKKEKQKSHLSVKKATTSFILKSPNGFEKDEVS